MKNAILRQFEHADAQAVYDLHVTAMKQAGTYVGVSEDGQRWDEDFENIEDIYIKNRGEFYVVTVGGKTIGMGALREVDQTAAEIKRMRVDPELQGKGIGALILDRLIQRAKELGYKKLILDVAEKQKIAQRLYESRGFTKYKRGTLAGQETIWYELCT